MIKKNREAKRHYAIIVTIVALCSVFLLISACKQRKAAEKALPFVQTIEVVGQDAPVYADWIGTTDGKVNALIRAQVEGYLISQNYREGDFVRKGQMLFEIDPRPFQAALDQAKGQLAEQQARWANAKANLDRIKPLAAQNAVSKKDADDATGQEQATHAAVISAQAAVEKAALNLGFTKITSPIDGIAGIAKVQIGNLVGPGVQEELTTVSTVDPILVYVPVSEQEYLNVVEKGGERFRNIPLEMVLASGSVWPYKGYFALADRQVNVMTGTIKLAAYFNNPGNVIRPGQFARIHALVNVIKGALEVPQRAVTELQGSFQVAVVGPDNKVVFRTVKTGERLGSVWVIEEGLKPGEKVIVEGLQRVKEGMLVQWKPYSSTPQPQGEAGTMSEQKKTAQPGPENK